MPIKLWERLLLVLLSMVMIVAPNLILSIVCLIGVASLLVVNKIRSKNWDEPMKGALA